MRITAEHAAHITAQIHRAAQAISLEKLREHRALILKFNPGCNIALRLRWDLSHWAPGLSAYLCEHVYHYADDTHVDTVLRAALKSLPAEFAEAYL